MFFELKIKYVLQLYLIHFIYLFRSVWLLSTLQKEGKYTQKALVKSEKKYIDTKRASNLKSFRSVLTRIKAAVSHTTSKLQIQLALGHIPKQRAYEKRSQTTLRKRQQFFHHIDRKRALGECPFGKYISYRHFAPWLVKCSIVNIKVRDLLQSDASSFIQIAPKGRKRAAAY